MIKRCGGNATENHPIIGARIKQAALKGTKLIVIDPRRIELADYASLHLRPRPGTNIPLLNAIAYTIIDEDLHDDAFVRERVEEWAEFRKFIKDFAPEKAEQVCGVKAELIREAARAYAATNPRCAFTALA